MIKLYEAERQVYYFRSDPYWPDVNSLGERGFSGDSFIYFSVKSCGFVCLLYVHSEAKDGQRQSLLLNWSHVILAFMARQ